MNGMSGFAEKLNVQICENSTRNCVCYMYGMLGLAEKLHILICINSTGNCAHYMYGMSGFAEKLNVQICENSLGNCIFPVRNFWICRKIEYPKLRKFNGKLCTLHTYGRSGFAEKLNVQNSGNSTGNSVRYMYGMYKFAKKLNIQIGRAHV